jgi:integrase
MIEHESPDDRGEPEASQRRRKRRSLGKVFYQPGSANAYIEYWWRGKRHRESCGSPLESVATRLLRKRQGELEHQGKVIGPRIETTTYMDGEKALLRHFDNKGKYTDPQGRKSVLGRLKYLKRYFGRMLAVEIRPSTIEEYVAMRRRQGAAKSTVKTEVRWLHLALVRLVFEDKLVTVPTFPRVESSPPREGSATPEEIRRVRENMPEYLQALVTVAYVTGWRGKHLCEMTWSENVLPGPVLFLPKIEGNKKRAKDVHFDCSGTPWLVNLIEQQRRRVAELAMAQGKGRRGIVLVFPNPKGEQITENAYKLAWQRARKRADVPKLRRHDMRRSATQNNRQLGLDKRVRMDLVGHKTEAVHDDYDAAARPELKRAAMAVGDYLAPALGQSAPAYQPSYSEESESETFGKPLK